ncbi:MAG: T9SS type A sorting domain-containing protein [Bacteroidetes bacterium]|nr:T9SS type A sorting domain-containing protein [Bacteroidota bacterium]
MAKKTTLLFILLTAGMAISDKTYAAKFTVQVSSFQFSPSTFSMNLGDTVIWQYVNGSHTTTSTVIPNGAAPWNSPMSPNVTTFLYVPAVVGTYNYQCNPHSGVMQASFVVLCPPVQVAIAANGPTTFCKGGSVTLAATPSTGTFKWQKNGVDILGAVMSTYTVNQTGTFNYSVIRTNNCGNTSASNAIQVKVKALPAATITPKDTVLKCAAQTITMLANSGNNLTYQWRRNATLLNGQTNQVYMSNQAGTYRVIVTNTASGCSRTSLPTYVINNCREGNQLETDLAVGPNPFSHDFSILLPVSGMVCKLEIYSISGQRVFAKTISETTSGLGTELEPGMYFIRMIDASTGAILKMERLIKN